MTTAHRPTWDPAMATNSSRGTAISQQTCARDQPAQLDMKLRQDGQDTSEEVRRRNLREELEERENKHYAKRKRGDDDKRLESKRIKYESPTVPSVTKTIERKYQNIDADDEDESENDSEDESDDDDSDEESDDEEELMKELEKIRKERMQEQQRQQEKKEKEREERNNQALLTSNPLIAMGGDAGGDDYSVEKKWWQDTVFRNQAKEIQQDESFINDSLRNSFHRKFMDKYIK